MSAAPLLSLREVVPGDRVAEIAQRLGTPIWIYDADTIRRQIATLHEFDVVRYAQKASSNLQLLRLMRAEGVHTDAVSRGELERALLAGYEGAGDPAPLVFTADLLDRATLARVVETGVTVNAGSVQMLEQLGRVSPGHRVWMRVNPGFGHGDSPKTNTGGPQSKHGIWQQQLDGGLELIDRYRLELVGLHLHIGSGTDYEHLRRVGAAMVEHVRRCGRPLRWISAGGGLSIPCQAEDDPVDPARYYELWDDVRREAQEIAGQPVGLEVEPGRYLVGQAGLLVTEVRASKDVGDNHFVLVDGGFNDLMRPTMYGSAHRISILDPDGRERTGERRPTVVAGHLCEPGDVFTQGPDGQLSPRLLPEPRVGDLLVFHDVGAYGASMSSNYNSWPLSPEVLVDGAADTVIRRRQTVPELLGLEL